MHDYESRKHRRLPLKLGLSFSRVGASGENFCKGHTLNISTGGMLLETATEGLGKGSLINIELSVPPTNGLLEFGGKISGFARVLRVRPISFNHTLELKIKPRYNVAVEFCHAPKLCV